MLPWKSVASKEKAGKPASTGSSLHCLRAVLLAAPYLQLADTVATYPSEFRFSWCVGPHCYDQSISAAHFQMRITQHYAKGARPPIKEALFVATLPAAYQRELIFGCPGLIVLSYLLLAEARLYTHSVEESAALRRRVDAMMAMPELAGPHKWSIEQSWPFTAAAKRYEEVSMKMEAAQPMSLDIVLPHCNEDLSWLGDRTRLEVLPKKTRIFVYEKCGGQSANNLSMLLEPSVQIINMALPDADDPRTGRSARRDECTAYLAHVVTQYLAAEQGDAAGISDMTLFLHGDPGDHTPWGLLNLVLRGIAKGSLSGVDFVHLGAPRMVHTTNPCQQHIFESAIGRPQKAPLSTYCCSQFGVSRARMRARPLEEYVKMLSLVDGSSPDICERIGPSYEKYAGQRLSHCFFLEFMWHVVFGENEELPLRGDDHRLPLFLRWKDNEELLPSIWHSYLGAHAGGPATFSRQGHEYWMAQIRDAPLDVGRPKQVNYGDFVQQ